MCKQNETCPGCCQPLKRTEIFGIFGGSRGNWGNRGISGKSRMPQSLIRNNFETLAKSRDIWWNPRVTWMSGIFQVKVAPQGSTVISGYSCVTTTTVSYTSHQSNITFMEWLEPKTMSSRIKGNGIFPPDGIFQRLPSWKYPFCIFRHLCQFSVRNLCKMQKNHHWVLKSSWKM